MRQIGLKLKELRDAKGWTQDDLAEATGMNRVTIAKYESGRSEPKSASLGKLDFVGFPFMAGFLPVFVKLALSYTMLCTQKSCCVLGQIRVKKAHPG